MLDQLDQLFSGDWLLSDHIPSVPAGSWTYRTLSSRSSLTSAVFPPGLMTCTAGLVTMVT